MAYIANQDDEELKKQAQQSGFLGDVGGAGAGVTGAPKPANGSGWTNLRSYLDANKDQAVDLSNKIAGNITKTGEEARGAVESGVKGYESELAKSNPNNVTDTISRANADPVGFSKSGDVQSFKKLRDGIFGGPSTFETSPGYGATAAAADKGSKLKTLAETEGGQQELIRDLNRNMGQGKVDLNQLLVSGNPTARTNLINAAQPFANLRSELDQAAGKQNVAREQAVQGTQAASNRLKSEFVAPQQQALKTLQDQINARVSDSSLDFNKDQIIRDLQAYMGGANTLDPMEKAQFLPEGGNYSGYNIPALQGIVANIIKTKLNPVFVTPDMIQQGVDYLISGAGLPGQYNIKRDEKSLGDMTGDYALTGLPGAITDPGDGVKSQEYQQNPFAAELDPIRREIWKYSNDPFERLRGEGAINDPNWLQTYFAGTNLSSGNPTPQSVASPDEYARILALQNLLDQPEFFSESDLASAGTYNPARIGKYRPLIQNNTGTQFPGMLPPVPKEEEDVFQNGPNRFF